jgi:hypothetical protein
MPKTIAPAAIDLLQHAHIQGNLVTFPQVEYSIYAKVKPVMLALDAPWNRSKQAHVFAEDIDPSALINQVLIAGKLPDQNPLAFFPTPPSVVGQMLQKIKALLPTFPFCSTLEPEAGEGGIADEIVYFPTKLAAEEREQQPQPTLKLIELDKLRFKTLKQKGYNVEQADFLALLPDRSTPLFQAILMNPPFAVAGNPKAYIEHIAHAFAFWLALGGSLVAIAPAGFATNSDQRTSEFRALVEAQGGWMFLKDNAFKDAGTNVRTVMLWMTK